MKKINYLYLLIFVLLLIPSNVFAQIKITPKLECPTTVKIGKSATCSIKADIEGGKIESISATTCITLPGEADCNPESYSGFNSNIGEVAKNITIGTIEVKKENITKVGNLTVSLNFNSGVGKDDEVIFTEDIFNETIKVLNNDATLANLTLDSVSIIDALDKEHKIDKESVEIGAVLNDKNASIISGTGKIDLKCGKNIYEVVTKAEDETKKTYKITIERTCSSDTTLKEIKLSSGSLSPAFKKDIKEYTLNVSKDIDKITIKPVATSDKAKVLINNDTKNEISLNYGENKIVIEVTSEDNKKTTYTITINREDGRSTNNYLESLELSDGKLIFSKEELNYDVKVLYDVKSTEVTAIPEAESSKVEITGGKNLKVGENTITIKVTSENGLVNEYKINVRRLNEGETLGDNPNIKEININGYNLEFDPEKTNYTLKIDKEESLDIEVIMEDETSSYLIEGNENLKNKSIITIKTMSTDGTTNTYKIVIEKTSFPWLLIIAVVAVIISGILIFIILKNKNKKPKVKTKVVKDEKLLSKVNKQIEKIDEVEYTKEKVVKEATIEEVEEYKICSLCGHKIRFESKICPYCKKDFTKSE